MKVYKRLRKAQEVAKGSPVVQCGEFYIVGMAPFSEVRILDPDGYVTGNVTMENLESFGNINLLVYPGKILPELFTMKNFGRAGLWSGGN